MEHISIPLLQKDWATTQKIILFQDTEYWLVLSIQISAVLEPGVTRSETAGEKIGNGFEYAAESKK